MANIKKMLNASPAKESEDYKRGWRDAVSHVGDTCTIKDRKEGDTYDISIDINITADEIIDKLKKEGITNEN